MPKTARRLDAENVSFTIGTEGDADHVITVNLGYEPETRRLVEIAFCESGKIGQGLNLLFNDLGLKLSRALQGRDPETGEELA